MPIKFVCPVCQAKYSTPDSNAGNSLTCASCKNLVLIPGVNGLKKPARTVGYRLLFAAIGVSLLGGACLCGPVGFMAGRWSVNEKSASGQSETKDTIHDSKSADALPNTQPARGNYPAPVSKFNGRTAAQWAEPAKDADVDVCGEAARSLGRLEAEGIPFLLEAAEAHDKKGRVYNMTMNLGNINGKLVETPDLARVAVFLDVKHYTSIEVGYSPIIAVIRILKQAGPRSLAFAPKIEEIGNDPARAFRDPAFQAEVRNALSEIRK